MPDDNTHIILPVITDSITAHQSDTGKIVPDSLHKERLVRNMPYPADTIEFSPHYTKGLSAYTPAPVENPLTDYKEAVLVIPKGLEGMQRTKDPAHDEGIFLILLCCFILVATSFRKGIKLFSLPFSTLKSNRNHADASDNATITESRLQFVLLAQTLILEGILLTFLIHYLKPDLPYIGYFKEILCMTGITVIYYNLQQSAYRILGFIFSEPEVTRQWVKEHSSINLLLGTVLFPIVFCMIYLSGFLNIGLLLGAICYILSRIIFIYKEIKIFLSDVYGILYFILYLCTLEIMPLFFIYKGMILIYQFVEFKTLTF